jgi:hypothetical protein
MAGFRGLIFFDDLLVGVDYQFALPALRGTLGG